MWLFLTVPWISLQYVIVVGSEYASMSSKTTPFIFFKILPLSNLEGNKAEGIFGNRIRTVVAMATGIFH